jgi:hypothetical protein
MLLALSLLPFALLATLNSAGYRYGASDQAFYVPAVLMRLDAALFPRDGALIAAQAKVIVIDELMGAMARLTGASLPALFGSVYVVSLCLLATAAWLIAVRLYRSAWTAVALLAALTLRHAIARSGTNTLEGYFHPRQLAFALGALALAALLRERRGPTLLLLGAAACIHPTTALWFIVWVAIAWAVTEPRVRVPVAAAAAAGAVVGGWALTAGPLAGRLTVMDQEWLATLATKDYLFPLGWPIETWLLNLAYAPIIVLAYRSRAAAGLLARHERGIVGGCLALLLIFALSLPFNAARLAIVVQLQIPRVFWMLDFLATIYAVWALAEGARATITVRRAQWTLAAILLFSSARGAYVLLLRFPERPVAEIGVRNDDWGRAMAWARATAPGSGWLADPMHAVQHGTSLRVAGERDVFVEAVKDTAVGMYDRGVAMRTRDRLAEIGSFDTLDAGRARALASAHGLDFLIIDRELPLPLVFESGALRVYRIGTD